MQKVIMPDRGPKSLKLRESDVVRQVLDFLMFRHWRPIRNQRTIVPKKFQTGEPGMADFLFVKYAGEPDAPGLSLTLWIEFKSQDGRVSSEQSAWLARERERGGLAWIVDDFDEFGRKYAEAFGSP